MTDETRAAVQKIIDEIDLAIGDLADLHCEVCENHGKKRVDRICMAFEKLNEAADILQDYMEEE